MRAPAHRPARGRRGLAAGTERLRDRELDLLDGIKVFGERGWAQILPDPDEPLVHIYAEGQTEEDSKRLEAEYRGLVEEIMQSEGLATPA